MAFVIFKRLISRLPQVIGVVCFFLTVSPAAGSAQKNEFQISFYRSKVTIDPLDGTRFFNATSMSFSYGRYLINTISVFGEINFLSSIETEGGQGTFKDLNRFSKTFVSLDAGTALTPVLFDRHSLDFGVGLALRNRKEVYPELLVRLDSELIFTQDRYINTLDFGAFFFLRYNYMLSGHWFTGVKAQMQTFNEGDSVFDVGISLGKNF